MAVMAVQHEHVRGAPVGVEGWVLHGCKCPDCKDAYYALGDTPRARRIASPVKPAHVHGTWTGFSSWGCRCEKCLSACRQTYTYAAAWRENNREHLAERQRERRKAAKES